MMDQKIAVIGMGFVGLPLALSFAMRGAKVVSIDVNEVLVKETMAGITHHKEAYKDQSISDILKAQLEAGRFTAATSYDEQVDDISTYIVTVGIPIVNGKPNNNHLQSAAEQIAKRLKKGDVVIIRSTVIPGMTNGFVKPILEKSGLTEGVDFHLAYASERIAEGRAFDEFENMPLVVGVNQKSAGDIVTKTLGIVTKAPIHVASSIEVVETSKVIENVQRDVNIAMVQEFARFAESMGIDTYELIQVANTHKRVNLLTPGAGVGGYCIPNAYHYLKPKADEMGMGSQMELLKTARQTNEQLPEVMVGMIEQGLKKQNREGKTVAVFGLAMKDFSNDDRISPSTDIVNLLIEKGYKVKAYDPAVVTTYDYKVSDPYDCVEGADVLAILVEQEGMKELDYQKIATLMNDKPVLVDLKHISKTIDSGAFFDIVRI